MRQGEGLVAYPTGLVQAMVIREVEAAISVGCDVVGRGNERVCKSFLVKHAIGTGVVLEHLDRRVGADRFIV